MRSDQYSSCASELTGKKFNVGGDEMTESSYKSKILEQTKFTMVLSQELVKMKGM